MDENWGYPHDSGNLHVISMAFHGDFRVHELYRIAVPGYPENIGDHHDLLLFSHVFTFLMSIFFCYVPKSPSSDGSF